jgi:DNA-binding winged helix-turn-helix (wHTH) protein
VRKIDHTTQLEPRHARHADERRAFLVVLEGQGVGLTIRLDAERTIIGRGQTAGIVLNDQIASREHAVISRVVDREGAITYHVKDLLSTNGTFVNNVRLADAQPLRQGDKIRIGAHLLKFALMTDAEAEPLTSPDKKPDPAPAVATDPAIHFGDFHLLAGVDLLYRGGEVVPLEPRAVRVLRYLAENHQRVVTKEELLEAVWPEVFTTDAVLKTAISKVRRALGESEARRFVETYHGRGYRFVAPVGGA